MLYRNQGYAQGILQKAPHKVAEGVVLLTVRLRDSRINPTTQRREFHFPTFVVFGKESDKALTYLEKGQEVSIEYKLETRRKEINGETKYFEDKIVTRIQYGRKAEPRTEVAPQTKAVPQTEAAPLQEVPKEDN